MPGDAIVDASAVGAVLYIESESSLVEAAVDGRPLFAPTLLPYELVNIGLKKLRRGQIDTTSLGTAMATYHQIAITLVPVDAEAVLALATTAGLSAYDASYLWLAREMNADLLTLDKALAAAAGTHSIARTE